MIEALMELMKPIMDQKFEEGGIIKLYELVQKKKLSIADAADDMDITEEEFKNKMKLCGYKLP